MNQSEVFNTPEKKAMARALHQLCMDNTRGAKKTLTKALGLIEVLPERDCSYTYNSKTGKGVYSEKPTNK